jgi:hypothetical protein
VRRAIDLLIAREDLDAVVKLASPNSLPNDDFMRAIRKAYGSPIALPALDWIIEIGAWLFGTESELVLKSRFVVPGRLMDAGFSFLFPDWPGAARDLVARWRRANR